MKKNWIVCSFVLLIISICSFRCYAAEESHVTKNTFALKSAKLSRNSPRKLPLNQNYLVIDDNGADKGKKIPIILLQTGYKCIEYRIIEGRASERGSNLICYELRSVSEDSVFSWAMWSSSVLGHFRLFTNDKHKNYLVWVRGAAIEFIRISESKDKVVALTEYQSGKHLYDDDLVLVPVLELLGRSPFGSQDASYVDMFVQSLNVEDDGKVTIKLTGSDEQKVYTLIREHGKWRDATNEKKQ